MRDHDKGGSDHSNHKYEPPYSPAEEVFDFITGNSSGSRDGASRNGDYNDGWQNSCDQTKGRK